MLKKTSWKLLNKGSNNNKGNAYELQRLLYLFIFLGAWIDHHGHCLPSVVLVEDVVNITNEYVELLTNGQATQTRGNSNVYKLRSNELERTYYVLLSNVNYDFNIQSVCHELDDKFILLGKKCTLMNLEHPQCTIAAINEVDGISIVHLNSSTCDRTVFFEILCADHDGLFVDYYSYGKIGCTHRSLQNKTTQYKVVMAPFPGLNIPNDEGGFVLEFTRFDPITATNVVSRSDINPPPRSYFNGKLVTLSGCYNHDIIELDLLDMDAFNLQTGIVSMNNFIFYGYINYIGHVTLNMVCFFDILPNDASLL